MGETPSYTCMKDALKYKSMFTLKATRELPENKKVFEFTHYPNKGFVFKISYDCISTTSVGAVFCLFTFLAKIETEGDEKPL